METGKALGFVLDAEVRVSAWNRLHRERLCRYLLRPPLAKGRLHKTLDGKYAFELKTPWSDGTRVIFLSGEEPVGRLTALVPPPIPHWRTRLQAFGAFELPIHKTHLFFLNFLLDRICCDCNLNVYIKTLVHSYIIHAVVPGAVFGCGDTPMARRQANRQDRCAAPAAGAERQAQAPFPSVHAQYRTTPSSLPHRPPPAGRVGPVRPFRPGSARPPVAKTTRLWLERFSPRILVCLQSRPP